MKIAANEGHGRKDGLMDDVELTVPVCRYGFPKNPCQNWLRIRNRKLVTNS